MKQTTQATDGTNAITLLSIDDVTKHIRMSRAWIYRQIKKEKFPKPVRVGSQKTAWKLTDITEWVNALPQGEH